MAPKRSAGDPPPVVVGEHMRTSTAPGIDGAHVDEVTSHISRYLRSYAALSVELLGRWPAYVPEDERYFESPTSWTTAELAPTMPPHLLRPAPDEVPEEKGKRGKKSPARAPAPPTDAEEELAKLKAVVEETNEKMRGEVEAKQKALKAVAKLTAQTQELQRENASLLESKEKEGSKGEKLQRDLLRSEEDARNAHKAKEKAEAQAAKDRKARMLAQVRLDTLQKDTAPLANDHKHTYETLLLAEEQRTKAEGREARSDAMLAETNSQARLLPVTLALALARTLRPRPPPSAPRPTPLDPHARPTNHTLHALHAPHALHPAHPAGLAGGAAPAAAGRAQLAAARGARGARHRHARDRAARRPEGRAGGGAAAGDSQGGGGRAAAGGGARRAAEGGGGRAA